MIPNPTAIGILLNLAGVMILALGPTTVRLWSSGARSEPKGPLGWFMFVVGWGCIFVGVIFLLVGALR